jgi:hypothetical protein
MTKQRTVIIIVSALVIIVLLITAITLNDYNTKLAAQVSSLNLKREKVLSEQAKLEAMINDLNSTLTAENAVAAALKDKLASLDSEKAASLAATQAAAAAQATPVVTPTLTPKPVPTRTTRAS